MKKAAIYMQEQFVQPRHQSSACTQVQQAHHTTVGATASGSSHTPTLHSYDQPAASAHSQYFLPGTQSYGVPPEACQAQSHHSENRKPEMHTSAPNEDDGQTVPKQNTPVTATEAAAHNGSASQVHKLLRVTEVLELFPVSRTTLYKMIREERFPAPHKVGRRSFWHQADVEAFISNLSSCRMPEHEPPR